MKFRKTNLGFYFFVNNREVAGALINQTCDNVILLEDLKEDDIKHFLETGYGGFFLIYKDGTNEYRDLFKRLQKECQAEMSYMSNEGILDDEYDGIYDFKTFINYLNKLDTIQWLKDKADREGTAVHIDYEGLCGNCHKPLWKDDKYCRHCGTKRGEGDFRPFTNPVYCVYGPLMVSKFKCPKCNYEWKDSRLGGYWEQCCPNCGEKNIKPTVMADLWNYAFEHQDEDIYSEETINKILNEAEKNEEN